MCHHDGVERERERQRKKNLIVRIRILFLLFNKGKQIRTHNMSEFNLVYFIDGYSSEYISSKHEEKKHVKL